MVEIIGHQRQCDALLSDLASDNVAHAYLFVGPVHLGKMTVARWFAEELLAAGLDDDREQAARRQARQLIHPDLLVLDHLWIDGVSEDWDVLARSSNAPQEHRSKKSAPAKTDTIGIDDVRALQALLYAKGIGRYRCCIIGSIERMKDEAANALLKILEEPPERLVFILTAQAQASLLPTIVSRTRTIPFHPVGRKDLMPLLERVPDEDARFILQRAQGAPGIVRSLAGDPDSLRLERQVHGQAHAFWESRDLRNKLHILSVLHKRGDDADRLLLHIGLALREQEPPMRSHGLPPYLALLGDLETNAHRQLAAQRFALCT